MNRRLSPTLSLLLLLTHAGLLACVTAPPTPRSRAEAEVRPKAELLCQHELLYELVPSRFPQGARPEDYARRQDVDFLAAHPERARGGPLDKPGLPEELARSVRCEVTDVRVTGDAIGVTVRRTAPKWAPPRFNLEELAQAATREEARAVLERWTKQGPEMATTEHRAFFVWTEAGWRVGYWLPEKAASASPAPTALPPKAFSERMTRPEPLQAPKVSYTREAHDKGVQGLLVLQCLLTREGAVENCRVLKPLPYLSEAAVAALHASRYTPATFNGAPVDIDYTFNLVFMLPRR